MITLWLGKDQSSDSRKGTVLVYLTLCNCVCVWYSFTAALPLLSLAFISYIFVCSLFVKYSTVIIVSSSSTVTVTVVFIYFKVVYLHQDYLMPSNL